MTQEGVKRRRGGKGGREGLSTAARAALGARGRAGRVGQRGHAGCIKGGSDRKLGSSILNEHSVLSRDGVRSRGTREGLVGEQRRVWRGRRRGCCVVGVHVQDDKCSGVAAEAGKVQSTARGVETKGVRRASGFSCRLTARQSVLRYWRVQDGLRGDTACLQEQVRGSAAGRRAGGQRRLSLDWPPAAAPPQPGSAALSRSGASRRRRGAQSPGRTPRGAPR